MKNIRTTFIVVVTLSFVVFSYLLFQYIRNTYFPKIDSFLFAAIGAIVYITIIYFVRDELVNWLNEKL